MAVEMAGARQAVFEAAMEAATVVSAAVVTVAEARGAGVTVAESRAMAGAERGAAR